MSDNPNKPVLTIKINDKATVEIYALNPKESFEGFGGSRHSLIVEKTASIITRLHQDGMEFDTERDLRDDFIWRLLEHKLKAYEKLFNFVEEITLVSGRFPELNGTPIVSAANNILSEVR